MRDTWTVVWKEWKELSTWDGGWVALSSLAAFAGLVGVFLPWQVGRPWIEAPWTMVFWAWMPLFLVTTVIADSFAGERERRTLETLLASRLPDGAILFGKVAAAVAWVWGATMLCLPLGVATVNVAHVEGELLLYPLGTLAGIASLAFLAAAFGAGLGVLVSLRSTSVRQAQQVLTVMVLVLFLIPVFGLRALPDSLLQKVIGALVSGEAATLAVAVGGVLAVLDVLLLGLAASRFRRDRLLAD